jgi:hypothetical protein
MTLLPCAALASWLILSTTATAEWRADTVAVPSPGRVTAVEPAGTDVHIAVGRSWYRFAADAGTLEPVRPPDRPAVPAGALSDARVATGTGKVARAWLSDPTQRYRHGVLGDAIEAGSLVFERRDGRRGEVRLGSDAKGSSSSNHISTAARRLRSSTPTPRRSSPRRRRSVMPTRGSTRLASPISTTMARPIWPWSASPMFSAGWSCGPC